MNTKSQEHVPQSRIY